LRERWRLCGPLAGLLARSTATDKRNVDWDIWLRPSWKQTARHVGSYFRQFQPAGAIVRPT
jgi:hypothetical protein